MRRYVQHLSYANVMSTLAVFLVLGGAAWAAGGFVSASGRITGCVSGRTGVLRVVRAGGHCRRGEATVSLAHAPASPMPGPAGPAGPAGPPGPGAYSFSLGPIAGGLESVPFGTNDQMRLDCEARCVAQVAVGGAGRVLGTDERGTVNGPVTSSGLISTETPAIVDLTSVSGRLEQGHSSATIWTADRNGWNIEVELSTEEGTSNARLIGTATPTSTGQCIGGGPFGSCPGD